LKRRYKARSTAGRRDATSAAARSKRRFEPARVFLARTMRFSIAAPLLRKAAAVSSMPKPHRRFSTSAT